MSTEEPKGLDQFQMGFIQAVLFMNGASIAPSEDEFVRALEAFTAFVRKTRPEMLMQRH